MELPFDLIELRHAGGLVHATVLRVAAEHGPIEGECLQGNRYGNRAQHSADEPRLAGHRKNRLSLCELRRTLPRSHRLMIGRSSFDSVLTCRSRVAHTPVLGYK